MPDGVDPTGARNLRDLGGPIGSDGRAVRRGLLFRSEFPTYLDAAGVEALALSTAIDLRRDQEAAHEDLPWTDWGVQGHRFALEAGGETSWRAGYHGYLEHGAREVAAAVATIVRPGALPVLFFCAAGKDRTGTIAALVLSVLGVEREAVLSDYLLTADGIGAVVARLALLEPWAAVLAELDEAALSPQPELIGALLDWVEARGGAHAWLVEQGVPAAHLDSFREQVLGPDGGRPRLA